MGTYPYSVAVADLDGDGKPDLAAVNYYSGNVSVLLGKGDGTFQTAVNYRAGSAPQSVAVGDFNGDGKPDLAVANNGSANVSVLLGNGDGTFLAPVNYAAGGWPQFVATDDINNDGKPDLVVANFRVSDFTISANVSILLGNGDGTFRAPASYNPGGRAVAVADFNGDGRPDVAVANNGIAVLLGNGDGAFQTAVNFNSPGSQPLVVGDFNGDGMPDLAVVNSTGVSILLNTCRPAGLNNPPVADASATATRVISPDNRNARVVLDGSRSRDVDGDPLQFSWFVDSSATVAATGRVVVAVLSVGLHELQLAVNDGQATASDHIAVRVITAADAVDELIADVQAAGLRHPHSLLSQLTVARRAFVDGNFDLGVRHLDLFQDKLRELQERHGVDPNAAAALLRAAQAIVAAVNGVRPMQPAFTVCQCEKSGRVRMRFTGGPARTYLVEASMDLETWVPVGVGGERSEGEFEFEEAGAGLPACRFYRIVTP